MPRAATLPTAVMATTAVMHQLIGATTTFIAALVVLVAMAAAVPVQASVHVAAMEVAEVAAVPDMKDMVLLPGILLMAIMVVQEMPALPLVPWAISIGFSLSPIYLPLAAQKAQAQVQEVTLAIALFGMAVVTIRLLVAAVEAVVATAAQPATSEPVAPAVVVAAAVLAVA